jgi:uncharacterized protein (TIGR02996 family)
MVEAELLAQIVADPGAIEPRRVYADLLVARGDRRGELIQLQLDLAALDEDDPRRDELARWVPGLLTSCQAHWRGFCQALGDHGSWWERIEVRGGFVEGLTMSDRQVPSLLPAARAIAPIRSLHLVPLDPAATAAIARVDQVFELEELMVNTGSLASYLPAIAAWPHRGRLRRFDLGFRGTGAAQVVAASPGLAGVTALRLPGVDDDGLIAMARAPHLATVTSLQLESPTAGADGVAALLASPWARGLSRLAWTGDLRDDGSWLAAAGRLPALRSLRLESCRFGTARLRALLEGRWPALRRLELISAGLPDDAVAMLTSSRLARRLRTLVQT